MNKMDFVITCDYYEGKELIDYTCYLTAVSDEAIEKFGTERLGGIALSIESSVIEALELPEKTAMINFVFRNKELVGIGLSLICSLLGRMEDKYQVDYIYLESLNDKLTEYYKSLGFEIVKNKGMIAPISVLEKTCLTKNKRGNIPVIFELTN